MNALTALFEEDIQLQDNLDEIRDIDNESADLILSSIEERMSYLEKQKDHPHLFIEDTIDIVDDKPTDRETIAIYKSILDADKNDPSIAATFIEDDDDEEEFF